MKKLLYVSLTAALVALLSFPSCSKGPKGDTGAQGPKGDTGTQGPAGQDSVYHSPWAQLTAKGTTLSNGDSLYYEDFSASVVTQAIIDSGVVLSYVGLLNGTTVSDVENASDNGMITDAEVGVIDVSASYNFTTNDLNPIVYRFVVIPGSVLITDGAFQGLSKETIKKMNYSDLNKALGNTLSVQGN